MDPDTLDRLAAEHFLVPERQQNFQDYFEATMATTEGQVSLPHSARRGQVLACRKSPNV